MYVYRYARRSFTFIQGNVYVQDEQGYTLQYRLRSFLREYTGSIPSCSNVIKGPCHQKPTLCLLFIMKIKSNTTTKIYIDVSVSIKGLRQKKMELILLPVFCHGSDVTWQEICRTCVRTYIMLYTGYVTSLNLTLSMVAMLQITAVCIVIERQ